MRVAFVDTTLMEPPGGAQTWLADLAPSLVRRGWSVYVVTQAGADGAVAERLSRGGVHIEQRLWSPRHLPEERAALLATWVRAQGMHAYAVSVSADSGWLALPLLDSSVVTLAVVHSDGSSFYDPLSYYSRFVDRAVGVSNETYKRIISDCAIPPERARTIPYGVRRLPLREASARWSSTGIPGYIRLIYVGRLVHRQKRILDLPPLLRELRRRHLGFEIDIVGAGDDQARMVSLLDESAVLPWCRLWGWVAPSEVSRRLREADVFLLLSEWEGLPVALLEAMGHAVAPMVTSIRSGNCEVVRNGQNGYALGVGDIMGFADRIEALARDRAELARLKHAAWDTSGEFSVERMVAEYAACIEDAASSVPGKARAPRGGASFPVMPSCRSKYPLWARRLKWRLLGPASI